MWVIGSGTAIEHILPEIASSAADEVVLPKFGFQVARRLPPLGDGIAERIKPSILVGPGLAKIRDVGSLQLFRDVFASDHRHIEQQFLWANPVHRIYGGQQEQYTGGRTSPSKKRGGGFRTGFGRAFGK